MITRIPEAFVIATIVSATLNVALALIIAGMAHSWGIDRGRLIQIEQDKKVVPMKKVGDV